MAKLNFHQSDQMKNTENESPALPAEGLAAENGNSGNEAQGCSDDRDRPHVLHSCENGDPSLVMRMRDLEFETSKECISMGRGYFNMKRGKDRYDMERTTFIRASKDWVDDVKDIYKCSVCGSEISENMTNDSHIYCSDDCILEVCSQDTNSMETSIFDLFYPGETGTAQIRKEVVDGRAPCSVILQGQMPIYERLNILSKPSELMLRAEIGDDVLVEDRSKGFLRGVVVDANSSTYKVALIDYGEIVDVNDVYVTTENLTKVVSLGGVISFIGNETPRSKLIKFRVRERRPFGVWICDALESNESEVTELILEEWIPPLKMNSIPLESGCNVVITQYLDAGTMYVRRINNPWNEEYVRYNNDIAAYCVEAKKYNTMPNDGEICCARYEKDGSYYRAVVRGIEKNLVVTSFIDFGTEQLTKISDLRYLPSLAKQVPSFCSLIKLKGVDLQSSMGVISYLNRLTAYKCELILTFEGNSLCEAVLTDKYNGVIVNDIIRFYEIPTWIKNRRVLSKTGDVYHSACLEVVSFTCGCVEDVIVLNFNENYFRKHGIFYGTVNRRDYVGHLNGELKEKMTEFCSQLKYNHYLPRKGELCIAKFKGEWNRALCLGEKDVVCKLTLIDRGVCTWFETKNIRKILKDFLEMPALALKCAVSDIENMSDREKEDLLVYLKKMNGKTMPGVKILKQSKGLYYLSINIPPDFDLTRPESPNEGCNTCRVPEETTALAISCTAGGINYDDAIAAINSCIDFQALEIDEPRIRKLKTGLLILEIVGENSKEDAKLLLEELKTVLSQKTVKIGCLTKGKIKITGIEESVTKEEMIEKIAEAGGCDKNEVQVTTFIQSNPDRIAWIKCPLVSAIDMAEKGTILLGSSLVKIELQSRLPLRCFRCLRDGHIGTHCTGEVEESRFLRSSQLEHVASDCGKKPHSDLGVVNDLPAIHQTHSNSCETHKENGLVSE